MISDRNTIEYILEKLSQGFPKTVAIGGQALKLGVDSTALLVSSELSVFLTASKFSIMILTDMWDNKEDYGYATRGGGERNIKNICVSLLGGTAQEYLIRTIPIEAISGGFTRRVNFVFSNKKDRKIPWPTSNSTSTHSDLVSDLREISRLHGEFKFDAGARALFEGYYNSCEPFDFDDEATANYKVSKWVNASKVAMVLSAARDDSLEITQEDFQTAIDKIEAITNQVGTVFRAVGESPLVQATNRVLEFIESKGYASRQEILSMNWKHVTSDDLDRIIITLREANIIREAYAGKKTMYYLTAKGATKP